MLAGFVSAGTTSTMIFIVWDDLPAEVQAAIEEEAERLVEEYDPEYN